MIIRRDTCGGVEDMIVTQTVKMMYIAQSGCSARSGRYPINTTERITSGAAGNCWPRNAAGRCSVRNCSSADRY